MLFCFKILLGLALFCPLFHPLQQIYAKRRDLIDETQCQFPLLFADRGYMLAHRNTCWVTTVLCRARCEHSYFSLAIWNDDCVRRTKNIGKNAKVRSRLSNFTLVCPFGASTSGSGHRVLTLSPTSTKPLHLFPMGGSCSATCHSW